MCTFWRCTLCKYMYLSHSNDTTLVVNTIKNESGKPLCNKWGLFSGCTPIGSVFLYYIREVSHMYRVHYYCKRMFTSCKKRGETVRVIVHKTRIVQYTPGHHSGMHAVSFLVVICYMHTTSTTV